MRNLLPAAPALYADQLPDSLSATLRACLRVNDARPRQNVTLCIHLGA